MKNTTLSGIFYTTRASFAITSLCIGIYVYKLSMYARLHRYIDLDAVCVVVLYYTIGARFMIWNTMTGFTIVRTFIDCTQ